jgi:hypothetical protein
MGEVGGEELGKVCASDGTGGVEESINVVVSGEDSVGVVEVSQ